MPAPWQRWARRAGAYRRVLAAACAGLAVACTVAALHPRATTVGVVVAAQDLPSGSTLTSGDLAVARWPAPLVPTGTAETPGLLVGRVLAGALRRGEPVTDVRVLSGAALPRLAGGGMVAAPVRIADAGAAALLEAGDRVDVLAAPDGAAGGGAPRPATTVADAARVLAVSPDASSAGGLVVLAVDPATAARLAAAQAAERLSVILLPG